MALTEYKKIQIRRGKEAELAQANLLPGEFALSTDTGKVRICISGGNVVTLANLQEFQNLLDLSGDAYAALQELIKDLNKESVLTGVLSDISKLKDSVGSVNDSLKSVGTRNFLLNTSDPQIIVGTGSDAVNQTFYKYEFVNKSAVENGIWNLSGNTVTVTCSFDWEATGSGFAGKFYAQTGYTGTQSNTVRYTSFSNTITMSDDNTSGHSRVTLTFGAYNGDARMVGFRLDNVPTTVTLTISNIQIVKGSATTDWLPAPEDVGTVSSAAGSTGNTTLPGGLKMCWGYASTPGGTANATSSATITFPVAFTYVPNIQVSGISGGTSLLGTAYSGASTTGCTIYTIRSDTAAQGVTWFAIGY